MRNARLDTTEMSVFHELKVCGEVKIHQSVKRRQRDPFFECPRSSPSIFSPARAPLISQQSLGMTPERPWPLVCARRPGLYFRAILSRKESACTGRNPYDRQAPGKNT
jgi:hypothetical protein